MDGFVSFLKDVLGYTLPVILLWPAITIIKAVVNGIEGAGDIVNKVGNSKFGSKRLQAEADALNNNRDARALNSAPRSGRVGRVVDRVTGRTGRRNAQRRKLRYQDAEAGSKAAEAGFGVTDAAAAAHIQSIAKSNAQASAINAANNAKFVTGVATGATSVGSGLGAASDPDVAAAIAAQQARAVAEEIKNVELQANIPTDGIAEMARRMEEAIKDGNSIEARAYQNMLLNSGSKGVEAYRNSINGIPPSSMAGSTEEDLKRNILQNHSKVKDSAADIVKHASTANGTTLASVSSSAKTWEMSPEELAGQKTHSLREAEKASGISKEQAQAIRNNQRLYDKLDPEGKKIIDGLA